MMNKAKFEEKWDQIPQSVHGLVESRWLITT